MIKRIIGIFYERSVSKINPDDKDEVITQKIIK